MVVLEKQDLYSNKTQVGHRGMDQPQPRPSVNFCDFPSLNYHTMTILHQLHQNHFEDECLLNVNQLDCSNNKEEEYFWVNFKGMVVEKKQRINYTK